MAWSSFTTALTGATTTRVNVKVVTYVVAVTSREEEPRRLVWPVLAGLVLVAVPTVFGVYPAEAGAMWVGWRDAIGAIWLVVAALTVAGSARADERVAKLFRELNQRRHWQRARATEKVLSALLEPLATGIPDEYRLSAYLFDAEKGELLPWFPKVDADDLEIQTFAPGIGATGEAWSQKQTILVTDNEVSSDRYRLSPAQQVAFMPYRAVVATPVRTTAGAEIGMLTAISTVNDHHFDDAQAVEAFEDLAEAVGAVIEVLAPR